MASLVRLKSNETVKTFVKYFEETMKTYLCYANCEETS